MTNELFSVSEIREKFSLTQEGTFFLEQSKDVARRIVEKKERKLMLCIGPCSFHDEKALFFYAEKWKQLQERVKDKFFLLFRFFPEKSRTFMGWRGFLYDPFLDGKMDVVNGIFLTRKILSALIEMQIPCAGELLSPVFSRYYADLFSWGFIGARTASSQIHREMASMYDIPIGFKNSIDGNVEVAIQGALFAREKSVTATIDDRTQKAVLQKTNGNPYTHLVLRGAQIKPNYSYSNIKKITGIETIVIDCSHGNAKKDPQKQKKAFLSACKSYQKDPRVVGIMLESYLQEGSQKFQENPDPFISITDPCLSFEETENLVLKVYKELA